MAEQQPPKPTQSLDLRGARQRRGTAAPRHPERPNAPRHPEPAMPCRMTVVEGSDSGGLNSTGSTLRPAQGDNNSIGASLNDGAPGSQARKAGNQIPPAPTSPAGRPFGKGGEGTPADASKAGGFTGAGGEETIDVVGPIQRVWQGVVVGTRRVVSLPGMVWQWLPKAVMLSLQARRSNSEGGSKHAPDGSTLRPQSVDGAQQAQHDNHQVPTRPNPNRCPEGAGGDRRISLQQGLRDSSPLAAQGTLNDGRGGSQRSKPLIQHPRFRLAMGLGTFILILGGMIALLNRPTPIAAAWWNDSYQYRRPVTVTNDNGSTLEDFQVSFTLDTAALISAGKLQADCDDIRLVDSYGNELKHWIEENNPGCNHASTVIWTKIPNLTDGELQVIVYYGNPGAADAQDGGWVFDLFDDFSGGLGDQWVQEDSPTVSGGKLQLNAADDAYDLEGLRSRDAFCSAAPGNGDSCVLMMRVTQDSSAALGRLGFSNTLI